MKVKLLCTYFLLAKMKIMTMMMMLMMTIMNQIVRGHCRGRLGSILCSVFGFGSVITSPHTAAVLYDCEDVFTEED